jgi:hypothetical protein
VRAPLSAAFGSTRQAMTPEEFQAKLDAISKHKGVPYGRAYLLFDAEEKHSLAALKYKGYLAQSDAFKCFFLDNSGASE